MERFSPQSELIFVQSLSNIQTFKKVFFVCAGIDETTKNPIFKEIKEIFIFKDQGYFVLSEWKTNTFDEKLNAYKISKLATEELTVAHSDTLHHFAPFCKLLIDNCNFIVPEHIML